MPCFYSRVLPVLSCLGTSTLHCSQLGEHVRWEAPWLFFPCNKDLPFNTITELVVWESALDVNPRGELCIRFITLQAGKKKKGSCWAVVQTCACTKEIVLILKAAGKECMFMYTWGPMRLQKIWTNLSGTSLALFLKCKQNYHTTASTETHQGTLHLVIFSHEV